jgi:signal transduction histidine kinase
VSAQWTAALITEPRAEERVARTITAVTGVAAVLLLITSLGPMLSSAHHLNPLYAIGAPVFIFGGYAALVAATFLLPLPDIRRAQAAFAVLFLFVVLTWLPAIQDSPEPGHLNPWVLEIVTLGAVPAAIAWPAAVAWGYLVLNSIIQAPIRYFTEGQADWTSPLQYSLLTLTLGGIFTALAMIAMQNAKAVDAATAILRDAAARSAAASARAQEQTRLDALVHDEVMSTLYYASRGEAELDDSVRNQAKHALAQLERLRSGRDDSREPVPPALLAARLRSLVLAASTSIDFESTGIRLDPIPPEVAAAFAEATSEAARNSLIHAPNAARKVLLHCDDHFVRVEVWDDGPGFDPRDVNPHRLGIQVSIRGRMATLRGGSALVDSAPGRGTTVMLGWSDE